VNAGLLLGLHGGLVAVGNEREMTLEWLNPHGPPMTSRRKGCVSRVDVTDGLGGWGQIDAD
jgi:hypothetical protein